MSPWTRPVLLPYNLSAPLSRQQPAAAALVRPTQDFVGLLNSVSGWAVRFGFVGKNIGSIYK
eukprot:1522032-Rhodomonas_salina.2